ncbi:hypothetical protein RUM44_013980 [Polyplax serrata]|uniref:Uncharacterized protein n=1 Tax=Polyplax serrata TaxID=468196 RepID=A0ABR1BJA7_POLSC
MFPPNLQKSIRELDRQISMLETECENMETEKMDIGTRKSMTKDSFRSLPIKPFRTGPSQSSSPYGVKRHGLTNPRTLGKIVSAASVILEGQTECIQQRGTHFIGRQTSFGIEEVACRKVTSDVAQNQIFQNEVPTTSSGEKVEQKSFGFMEKSERKTMTVRSTKEVTESSGESSQVNVNGHSKLMCVTTSKTEQPDSTLEWNQKMRPKSGLTYCSNSNRPRLSSSDEDAVKEHSVGHSPSPKRNRPRSTRTKKKKETEFILDVNSEKPVREQETQCTIFREEWEKKEFLANLNDSVKTLHMLISELKKKNCQETQKDILNDMQSTLLKISQTKSNNPLGSTLNLLTSLQGGTLKVPEGEETIVDLKKVFYRVRQFCEQLSEEKYFLTEELAHRNRTIAGMKTKEKEYLSLISTLKLNLERTNQKSEEWDRAKKEVMMVRNKLEEETKSR